ncbi:phosphate/phosphite/phosphonate ABC transporter substrate-binding protein [Klebsiella oxytoca]|uniref:phosphate/phosphite/phosphonate ABC transporter substrate-binding protein n=1 Tax=Klebsiella oxytoca TaxID=571 RepID=UPI00157B9FA0|nr:PhnD/SsuA/transferrin family substrate-binding protein [Klebsiella oxytoca]
MRHNVDLPMYAIHPQENQALEAAVRELLQARGIAASLPSTATDLLTHWRQPDLLLSQTCGYPLVTLLPDVQTVGCFHYGAPGCEGIEYRSLLVTRAANSPRQLADFHGLRAVCNSPDSQSGYNVLRKMIAPLARNGHFFGDVIFSGSHRQSLIDLQQGAGDIAAIDCISWALLARHEPAVLEGLCVIERSPLAPGLPLITGPQTSAETLAGLRAALQQLVSDLQYRERCDAQFICGFSPLTRAPYNRLLAWREEARLQGVSQL